MNSQPALIAVFDLPSTDSSSLQRTGTAISDLAKVFHLESVCLIVPHSQYNGAAALEEIIGKQAGTQIKTFPRGRAIAGLLNDAVSLTKAGKSHLLYCDLEHLPAVGSFEELARVFLLDPLFGIAVGQHSPAGHEDTHIRKSFLGLPAYSFLSLPEGPAILVRDEVIANFFPLRCRTDTFQQAMDRCALESNRCGFRVVQANQACFLGAVPTGPHPDRLRVGPPVPGEATPLAESFPEAAKLLQDQENAPSRRLKRMLEEALHAESQGRKPSILLDAENLQPLFNGSSEFVIKLLTSLHGHAAEYPMTVFCSEEALRFHELKTRLPRFSYVHSAGDRHFAIGVRLVQPWSLTDLRRLGTAALFNYVIMLDTIAWDCGYLRYSELEPTWRETARLIDGFIYISKFTRDRFRNRFLLERKAAEEVIYPSLAPEDYLADSLVQTFSHPRRDDNAILVVGNTYHHKMLAPASRLLSEIFPLHQFNVLGSLPERLPGFHEFPSGNLPQERIEELFLSAEVVIYPSIYEGFGFPILKGLAYGKTVLARESALNTELKASYRGPGELITFKDHDEMVESLSHLLRSRKFSQDRPLSAPPSPTAGHPGSGSGNWDWNEVGKNLLNFVVQQSQDLAKSGALERLRFFDTLESAKAHYVASYAAEARKTAELLKKEEVNRDATRTLNARLNEVTDENKQLRHHLEILENHVSRMRISNRVQDELLNRLPYRALRKAEAILSSRPFLRKLAQTVFFLTYHSAIKLRNAVRRLRRPSK